MATIITADDGTSSGTAGLKQTADSSGILQLKVGNGTVTGLEIDASGNISIGGGYGSTGVSISAAGNIQANGTLTVDGATSLGVGSTDYTQITGGTGTTTVGAVGGSTNVNLVLSAKGTNSILFNTGGGTQVYIQNTASADQAIILKGGQSAVSTSTLTTSGGALVVGSSAGQVLFTTIGTTASAANAYIDNAASNSLLRSTSSIRYKQDIQDVTQAQIDAAMSLTPITYRSKAAADDPDRRWFGVIAEDAFEKIPELVTLGKDDNGNERPDGFQYERLVVLLLAEMQSLRQRIGALEAK